MRPIDQRANGKDSALAKTLFDLGVGYATLGVPSRRRQAITPEEKRREGTIVWTMYAVMLGYLLFVGVGVLGGYLYKRNSHGSLLTTHLLAGGALGLGAAIFLLMFSTIAVGFIGYLRARKSNHVQPH